MVCGRLNIGHVLHEIVWVMINLSTRPYIMSKAMLSHTHRAFHPVILYVSISV